MAGKKGRQDKNPVKLICECGISVRGISESHAKANLKAHQKSKIHKQIIANKSKEQK